MANVKISQLPEMTGAVNGTEYFETERGEANSQKISLLNLFKGIGILPAITGTVVAARHLVAGYNRDTGLPESLDLTQIQFAALPITIEYVIEGGGLSLSPGQKGHLVMPYSGTLQSWTILGDVSGSCVIDVRKTTYAAFPPTVANTITGSAVPTVAAAQSATSSTLTGWSTNFLAGDVMAFNVNSTASFTRLTLALSAIRS